MTQLPRPCVDASTALAPDIANIAHLDAPARCATRSKYETVLPYVVIGEHALIGAGSVVTHDIPARAVAYGNPARVAGTIDQAVCKTGLFDRPYAQLFVRDPEERKEAL